jgi:tRNA pseudouridine-54 N-methylase
LRISQTKKEIKRKSTKKAQAFLKNLKAPQAASLETTETFNVSNLTTDNSNIIEPIETSNKYEDKTDSDYKAVSIISKNTEVARNSHNFKSEIEDYDEQTTPTNKHSIEENKISKEKSTRSTFIIEHDFNKTSSVTESSNTAHLSQDDKRGSSSSRLTVVSTSQEKELIEKMLKSNSPKLIVPKLPNELFKGGTNLNSNMIEQTLNEQQRRLTRDLLLNNPTVLQICRITATSSNALSRNRLPISTVNSSAVKSSLNTGPIRHIDRITPSKLTKTELEEKRKLELAVKEAKERERLAELERQKQREREEKKKEREEKTLKVKAKQKEESEKYQIQQQQQMKLTTNASNTQLSKTLSNSSIATTTSSTNINSNNNLTNNLLASTQKKPVVLLNQLGSTSSTNTQNTNLLYIKSTLNNSDKHQQQTLAQSQADFVSSLKKSLLQRQQFEQQQEEQTQKLAKLQKQNNHMYSSTTTKMSATSTSSTYNASNKALENTCLLETPQNNRIVDVRTTLTITSATYENYAVTPLQPPRLKNEDNYDVSDLKSDDDTDDEDEPSKPLPAWAREPQLTNKVREQSLLNINFTKMFKASSQNEIHLEQIFRIKRKKFNERSSSANWSSPPVWRTNGLNGDESFRKFH